MVWITFSRKAKKKIKDQFPTASLQQLTAFLAVRYHGLFLHEHFAPARCFWPGSKGPPQHWGSWPRGEKNKKTRPSFAEKPGVCLEKIPVQSRGVFLLITLFCQGLTSCAIKTAVLWSIWSGYSRDSGQRMTGSAFIACGTAQRLLLDGTPGVWTRGKAVGGCGKGTSITKSSCWSMHRTRHIRRLPRRVFPP